MSLCADGAMDEHVEIQTLHANPSLRGADGEHEEYGDKATLPVLKVTMQKQGEESGSDAFFMGRTNHAHLIQRPSYQRGSPRQGPAGNRTTRRPDHRKEAQTAVVWSCLSFIRSGEKNLARHIERGKKTRQAEEEVGRQHRGMDRPGVRQVPEGSG